VQLLESFSVSVIAIGFKLLGTALIVILQVKAELKRGIELT